MPKFWSHKDQSGRSRHNWLTYCTILASKVNDLGSPSLKCKFLPLGSQEGTPCPLRRSSASVWMSAEHRFWSHRGSAEWNTVGLGLLKNIVFVCFHWDTSQRQIEWPRSMGIHGERDIEICRYTSLGLKIAQHLRVDHCMRWGEIMPPKSDVLGRGRGEQRCLPWWRNPPQNQVQWQSMTGPGRRLAGTSP